MTKKDYDLIAACIGASYKHFLGNEIASKAVDDVKRRMELELALDNPRFDRDKFVSRIQYWFKRHDGH